MAVSEKSMTRLNGGLTSVKLRNSRYRFLAKAAFAPAGFLQNQQPGHMLGAGFGFGDEEAQVEERECAHVVSCL